MTRAGGHNPLHGEAVDMTWLSVARQVFKCLMQIDCMELHASCKNAFETAAVMDDILTLAELAHRVVGQS